MVDGESDGGGELNSGVEVDTRLRGRSLVGVQLVCGESPPECYRRVSKDNKSVTRRDLKSEVK